MIEPIERAKQQSTLFYATVQAKIAQMSKNGADVIRLDVGSPDLPPANAIIQKMAESGKSPHKHGYPDHKGSFSLRDAWTRMYKRVYQVDLDPETEILPLLGSKEGIFHIVQAYIQAGDAVLIPDPSYPTYVSATKFAGGQIFKLALTRENDYLPDFSIIPQDILKKSKLLWLNFPHNPTTATANTDFFSEAVEFAIKNNLLICHDAAYTQVTFDGQFSPSILSVPGANEVAVEFNSLSKSHNMAGWRSGAILGNRQVIDVLYRLKTNIDSGMFYPVAEASIEAMNGDQNWILERNETYKKRRDVVIHYLHEMGLDAKVPQATIYVWSPIPGGWNSVQFVESAIEKAAVSLTPGTVFGSGGEGFVRISVTAPIERLVIAMERLKDWMANEL